MTEEIKKPRERKGSQKSEGFIPAILDKVLGTVEGFAGNILHTVNAAAEELINEGVRKLFYLLVLGLGIGFFLAGGAKIVNQLIQFPGIGEMLIGLFIVFVTSIFLLVSRRS